MRVPRLVVPAPVPPARRAPVRPHGGGARPAPRLPRLARGAVALAGLALGAAGAGAQPRAAGGAQPTVPPPVGAPARHGGDAHVPRLATAGWNTEHGLPSSIISVIAQSGDGYLWLATYEGLVRFDGLDFRTFGAGDVPGLERGSFVALVGEGTGTARVLWAGSESGEVVRYANGAWRTVGPRDGLPGAPVTALAADPAGGVWVGTRRGIWHLRGARAAPLRWPAGVATPAVAALAAGPDGTLWVGTVADGLLARRPDGTVRRLTARDGLGSDRIDALLAEPDGTVWVGAYGARGVARLRGGAIAQVGTEQAAAGPGAQPTDTAGAPRRVRAILRDRAGTLWLAAENGLFAVAAPRGRDLAGAPATLVRIGDPTAMAAVLEQGAAGAIATELAGRVKAEALAEDREGNLWVGTRQQGLFRLRAASFVALGAADGLPHPLAFAVQGDGAGGVWVATQDGTAHLPAGAPPARLTHLGAHVARDVLRDARGDVWLATTSGLTRLPGGDERRAVTCTRADGLSDDRVRALAEGRDGVIWAATFAGVSEWRPGGTGCRVRRYGPAEGLTDGYVLSVHEDRAGTLWVGTQTGGLFRCPAVAAAPGAPAGAEPPPRRCTAGPPALARHPVFRITEERDGTLWLGTGRGVARVRLDARGGRPVGVALLTPRHGLPGATVFQLLDDGRGGRWLTGPWGLGRVSFATLGAAADAVEAGRRAAVTVTPFGRGDGMLAREVSSIGRAWRAPDGRLWFPTPAGLAVVDPARLPPRRSAPPVLVEQLLADGVPFAPAPAATTTLTLRPGTRTLELRMAAPSLTTPEVVRLRWRLDGWDDDWVAGGTRRAAYYTNLPPGPYRFRVQARAGDGPWGAESTLAVSLAAYPWQRRPVQGAALALLVAAAVGAYRWRVRVVTRRAAADAAQAAREEALRDASLRDELTGLYNRRGLLALGEPLVRTARRERRGFTLLFADLDGLKAINDTHGHAAGDAALVAAARVLRATLRDADVLARLGGDEFAAILPDAAGVAPGSAAAAAGVEAATARLVEAVRRHGVAPDRPWTLSMSVGASRFAPDGDATFEALLADADRAMYARKRARGAARSDGPREAITAT